jgi:uncharacterized membrane protein HdeD (DUF308 family)
MEHHSILEIEQGIYKSVKNAIEHWWLSLLMGILFIGVGLWVFRTPIESYVLLTFIFSISFLVSGISEIFYALANRNELHGWNWIFMGGLFDLLLGLFLLSNAAITMVVLPIYVGFGVLFRSTMAIGTSIELKHYRVKQWNWFLGLGIVGVIFAALMIWNPIFAGLTIVAWTAFSFIAIGIFRILLAFRLRNLHTHHHHLVQGA